MRQKLLVYVIAAMAGLMIALPTRTVSSDRSQIGFVLAIEGSWTGDGMPLNRGEAVFAGAVINPSVRQPASVKHPRILVVLLDGTHLSRTCDQGIGDCAKAPLRLPQSIDADRSIGSKLLAIAARLFLQEPQRYLEAMSRSGSVLAADFSDSLGERSGGHLDLSLLFSNVPPGGYRVDLIPIDSEGRAISEASHSIDIKWDGTEGTGKAGIAPGLYRCRIFHNETDDQGEITSDVWLLVLGKERFTIAAAAYANFVRTANALESELGPKMSAASHELGWSH